MSVLHIDRNTRYHSEEAKQTEYDKAAKGLLLEPVLPHLHLVALGIDLHVLEILRQRDGAVAADVGQPEGAVHVALEDVRDDGALAGAAAVYSLGFCLVSVKIKTSQKLRAKMAPVYGIRARGDENVRPPQAQQKMLQDCVAQQGVPPVPSAH